MYCQNSWTGTTIRFTTRLAGTDSDILAIWNKMTTNHVSILRAPVKFEVGQHVRIINEKLKFARGCEQNYTTEIFKIQKAGLEFRGLCTKWWIYLVNIDGQFYGEKLSPVLSPKNRTYPILKMLRKRVRNGSIEYLVRWTGYSPDFASWISAKAVKKHGLRKWTHTFLRHFVE
jgi:hypothetical protein